MHQRAITQKRGIILSRKKIRVSYFSWGIHIWNFKTVAFTVLKLCYASKSVTNGRTDGRTDGRTNNPEAICPSNFFEVGGIIKKSQCPTKCTIRLVQPAKTQISQCICTVWSVFADCMGLLHSAASDLGLHWLLRPFCPNTKGYYSKIYSLFEKACHLEFYLINYSLTAFGTTGLCVRLSSFSSIYAYLKYKRSFEMH